MAAGRGEGKIFKPENYFIFNPQKKSIYIIRLIAQFYNVEVNNVAYDSFFDFPNQKVSNPPKHSIALYKPQGI